MEFDRSNVSQKMLRQRPVTEWAYDTSDANHLISFINYPSKDHHWEAKMQSARWCWRESGRMNKVHGSTKWPLPSQVHFLWSSKKSEAGQPHKDTSLQLTVINELLKNWLNLNSTLTPKSAKQITSTVIPVFLGTGCSTPHLWATPCKIHFLLLQAGYLLVL